MLSTLPTRVHSPHEVDRGGGLRRASELEDGPAASPGCGDSPRDPAARDRHARAGRETFGFRGQSCVDRGDGREGAEVHGQ